MRPFVDLLHRDEFSLKHALGNSKKILPILKERGQKYFAVANYAEISNWVQQLFSCKENGIVPILGMEAFVNNFRYSQIEANKIEVTDLISGEKKDVLSLDETSRDLVTLDYPIDLYAKTVDGYYNIIKIHNDGQLNGVDKRPRTSDRFLKDHGKGIICVLQTPFSEVGSLLFNGYAEQAKEKLEFYRSIFDEVYLSVSIVDDPEYSEINDQAIQFADDAGVKVIPVCNSHYIFKDDQEAWEIVLRMSRMRSGAFTYEIDSTPGLFYRTREEVDELYERHFVSEVFTKERYLKIQNDLDDLLSEFTLLDLDYDLKLPKFENGPEKLREKAWNGFKKKGYDKLGQKYSDRLNYELENIIGAGFADYFLVLEELFTWYRDELHGMTAFGRGSAAGSLVLNCIGCTNVDPIKYNLLFERFLDAERFRKIVESGGKVSGCFPGYTIIPLSNGSFKTMDEIEIGDEVISIDGTGRKVLEKFDNGQKELVSVSYIYDNGKYSFDVTPNHIFRFKDSITGCIGEKSIASFTKNDMIMVSDDEYLQLDSIKSKSLTARCFDLHIEGKSYYRVCGVNSDLEVWKGNN